MSTVAATRGGTKAGDYGDGGPGIIPTVDHERYGELTDEFEQMFSPEAAIRDGSVLVVGDLGDLLAEFVRYLVTKN